MDVNMTDTEPTTVQKAGTSKPATPSKETTHGLYYPCRDFWEDNHRLERNALTPHGSGSIANDPDAPEDENLDTDPPC